MILKGVCEMAAVEFCDLTAASLHSVSGTVAVSSKFLIYKSEWSRIWRGVRDSQR
jgi:hypothetical protein